MPNDLSAAIKADPMNERTDPRAWVGRTETRGGCLTPEAALMLSGALGHPAAAPVATHAGAPLPALWHWAAFPEVVPLEGLGQDGHPKLGGFLPPLPFPRRMWAGGRVQFEGALSIGEALQRRSEILSVDFKTGATGEMAFVKVLHDIRGAAGGRLREEHDLVYLPMPDVFRPPRPTPAPEAPDFVEAVAMGPVRLFRYSAATCNGHRIHYDRSYAREVEKYPDLVVHGPMQATLLIEAGIRHAGRRPRHFSYRGLHPVFDTEPLRLMGQQRAAGAMDLCTVAQAGHQGMQARLEWE